MGQNLKKHKALAIDWTPHMNHLIQLHEVFLPPSLCGHLWSQHGQLSASLASLGRCWIVTRIAWLNMRTPQKRHDVLMPQSYFDSEPEKLLKFFHWPDPFENSHGLRSQNLGWLYLWSLFHIFSISIHLSSPEFLMQLRSLIFHPNLNNFLPSDISWAFALYLESVAVTWPLF